MCATYGLTPSGEKIMLPGGLEPYSEKVADSIVAEWMRDWGGKANTSRTRKDGRTNLNPIVRDTGDGPTLELAWWWLHVGGVPAQFMAFNSRDDQLLKQWRRPFQHRALLPADWYNEGGERWALPDGAPFAIAAITSPRHDEHGDLTSYSMVTREAVGEATKVATSRGDSRMPLVLPAELYDRWLDPERPGDAALVEEIQQASEEISRAMTTRPAGEQSALF